MRWSGVRTWLVAPAVAVAAVAGLLAGTVSAAADNAAGSLAQPLAAPVWLCEPGMADNPCDQNVDGSPQLAGPLVDHYPSGATTPLDATTVNADGTTSYQPYAAPHRPPVDCFYVYPTVDTLPNPLLQIGSIAPTPQDQEMAVTLAQLARFSDVCRLFVPVYRQAPLPELAASVLTGTNPDYRTGELDIQQAWTDYWNGANIDPVTHRHRGVILLGHSQGSAVLENLIQTDIDGNSAVQPWLVSAILLGGNVQVPIGAADGGGNDADATFQHVPACSRASVDDPVPTGCVVAYSSYDMPAGQSAPSDGLGHSTAAGHQVLCVNPAALLAGTPADAATGLDTYLPTERLLNGNVVDPNGSLALVLLGFTPTTYQTGYAHYSDALTGQCSFATDSTGNSTWLEISGDDGLFPSSAQSSALGLHVVDYNVALGDLVQLAGRQSVEWISAHE